jgi:chemotaxis protein MotB
MSKNNEIIIKKVKKGHGHGHHGGAWKIALADFAIAMMAFFLLMWLLNATSEEQKWGIANYFDPLSIGAKNGGSRGVMGGIALQSNYATLDANSSAPTIHPNSLKEKGVGGDKKSEGSEINPYNAFKENTSLKGKEKDEKEITSVLEKEKDDSLKTLLEKEYKEKNKKLESLQMGFLKIPKLSDKETKLDKKLKEAKERYFLMMKENSEKAKQEYIKKEVNKLLKQGREEEKKTFEGLRENLLEHLKKTPHLKELLPNMVIDITEKGLRIQLIDQKNRPLFLSGSPEPMDYTHILFQAVTNVLQKVDNDISIAGHTDATPYASNDYTNWELSVDRAQQSRRLLVNKGVSVLRIQEIVGRADKDPFKANDPFNPENRRICITLLHKYKNLS